MGATQPLVSIIAISYNHAPYIKEALASVFMQTYPNIQLIVADDCSTDESMAMIEESCIGRSVTILSNKTNKGNCTTFNEAFKKVGGKYIIDFALDDLMYPDRVSKQVAFFESLDASVGVVFTNVAVVDISGTFLYAHYPRYHHPLASDLIPQGDVFVALLSRYYINPVSMMVRREVIEKLNGYDERLSYEDFDFWVRSSRMYSYAYLPELLSAKRIVPHSLASGFYTRHREAMFQSTLQVCKKAWWLCKNKTEIKALVYRCRYELKQALKYRYTHISAAYIDILKKTDPYYRISVCWIRLKAML